MKKNLIFLVFLSTSIIAFSQARQVTGTVTSAEDNLAIPGVSVIVKGTSLGVATDIDGRYSITVPESAMTLIFSFLGMSAQQLAIDGRTTIDVVMQPDLMRVDEVLVVAYGTAKRGAFTGSASQINSDKIEMRPVTNLTTAIEGSAVGVQVTAPDGQPGSSQSIRVRGFGSYSASNDPLYVVDGVPFSGLLNSINPNDIESMTILKDAASTTLYGNKAANGVVLITTKKGKAGNGQLSVNISTGVSSRAQPEYELIDAYQYYPIVWESYRNSIAVPGVDDPADVTAANQTATNGIYALAGENPFDTPNDNIVDVNGNLVTRNFRGTFGEDLDWIGAITRPGVRQNYDVSYQGGTEKTDFFVSLGYLNDKGWIIESDFTRFTGRANVNVKATPWFKTGFNISGTQSVGNMAQTGGSSNYVNPIRFTRGVGPIYPIHDHDRVTGEYILDSDGNLQFDLADHRNSYSSTGRHVIAEIKWDEDIDENTSVAARAYGEIKFLKDFRFTFSGSINQRFYYNTYFNNKFVGDGAPGGRSYRTFTRRNDVNFQQLLNWARTFGKHDIDVLLGHESRDGVYNNLNGGMKELIADGNTELINFVTILGLESYKDFYKTEGYFSRVNYNYNGKYFITGSYRRDGSSKFSPDNQWGDFWSVGLAWRMDEETFIQNIQSINMLKLRGSYGQVGNDAGINNYAYQALYSLGWNNQTASGFYQDKLEAPDLVWEANNSYDLALEFGFFSRMYGTIEFYHRISDNLLFSVPLPLSTGLDSYDANVGTLFNQGIEFQVSADIVQASDFRWNINLNFSTLKNEFTKLPQEEIIDGSKKIMVGHSIYDYWLKDWYGVDPDDGAALYVAKEYDAGDANIRFKGNDTLTVDQNNAKYHYAGTAIPDLFGAITNTFTYKGFELSGIFTYQLGGKVLDINYLSVMGSGGIGLSKSIDILNRWQKPGDITDVPRMDNGQTTNFNALSDRWLTDASFLNLRSLTLAYNLPPTLVGKIGLEGVRVYLSGENLFLLNARKGMNVQQEFSGTTSNVYTPSRIISIGLNVKFSKF